MSAPADRGRATGLPANFAAGAGSAARTPTVRTRTAARIAAVLVAILATAGCGAGVGTPAVGGEPATPSAAALESLRRLDTLVDAGKLDEAVTLAAGLVEREPNAVEIRLAHGLVLGQRDGFAAAVPVLVGALALDEHHLPTLTALARGYDEDGDTANALTYARRILAVDARNGYGATLVGRALMEGGDYDGALDVLTRAQGSGMADVFGLMGRAYARQGEAPKAEQSFRRALDLDPRSLEATLNLGQLLMRDGRTAAGQQLLDRHKALSAEADAAQFAEQSSQVSGAGSQNFLVLGEARRTQGDLAGAVDAFERAAARDPNDARPLIGLATVAMDRRAHDEALAFARQAVALDGQLPLAHLLYGVELIRAGEGEAAEAALDRSRRLAPWQAREWDMVGQALVDIDQLDDAIRAYEEARKLAPTDDVIALRLGYLHYALGDFARARDELRAASERSADNGDLMLALALALDRLGDPGVDAALDAAVARYARRQVGTPEERVATFRIFEGSDATLARFLERSRAEGAGVTPAP